jgi:hypothetical protein
MRLMKINPTATDCFVSIKVRGGRDHHLGMTVNQLCRIADMCQKHEKVRFRMGKKIGLLAR